jgi:hypothetical protein
MNPRGKQMKVKQPNVQELVGIPPQPENGAIPQRVVAIGKNPTIVNKSLNEMQTDHYRKNTASDGEY